MNTHQAQQIAADTAAAVSTAAGTTVVFTDWLGGWMEIGAAAVAIVAGLAAAWYHIDKTLWSRRQRKINPNFRPPEDAEDDASSSRQDP